MPRYFKRNHESEKHEVVEVKAGSIKGNKVVWALPGDFASSFSPEVAVLAAMSPSTFQSIEENGRKSNDRMTRILDRMAGGHELASQNGVELVVMTYDYTAGSFSTKGSRTRYNANPTSYYSIDAESFVTDNLVSIIAKNPEVKGEGGSKSLIGEKLSIEDLKQNLGSQVFMAYSHGAVMGAEICNCLRKFMNDVGYSKVEIEESLKEVKFLSVATMVERDNIHHNGFSTIHIQAQNDKVIANNIAGFVKSFDPEMKPPYLDRISENHLRVVCQAPEQYDFYLYKYGLERAAEKQGGKVTVGIADHHAHSFNGYVSFKPDQDNFIPLLAEQAFRNMVYGNSANLQAHFTDRPPVQAEALATDPINQARNLAKRDYPNNIKLLLEGRELPVQTPNAAQR